MRDFCADLGDTPVPTDSEIGSGMTQSLRISGGPKPSESRALEKFAGGLTMDAIALSGGIKLSTVQ